MIRRGARPPDPGFGTGVGFCRQGAGEGDAFFFGGSTSPASTRNRLGSCTRFVSGRKPAYDSTRCSDARVIET